MAFNGRIRRALLVVVVFFCLLLPLPLLLLWGCMRFPSTKRFLLLFLLDGGSRFSRSLNGSLWLLALLMMEYIFRPEAVEISLPCVKYFCKKKGNLFIDLASRRFVFSSAGGGHIDWLVWFFFSISEFKRAEFSIFLSSSPCRKQLLSLYTASRKYYSFVWAKPFCAHYSRKN